jgi:predicted transcriptional regulator of viral defense system
VPVHDLRPLLGPARTISTTGLARRTGPRSVGRWIADGTLVRLHPGWVTVPELAEDWTVRAHAATGYAGGPLSHKSALAVHGVVDQEVTRLNVTVLGDRRVRTSRWLRVHRTRNPEACRAQILAAYRQRLGVVP